MIVAQLETVGRALRSAAAFQQVHETLDSVSVKSPLPGGVRQVVRFLLTTVPPWVQIGGVLFGMIVGIAIIWLLIKYRRIIIDWLVSRSTAIKVALAVAVIVIVVGAAGAGAATWNYTQHANDFCTGCHVMDPAVEKMRGGTSKHAKLQCHSCHQQSIAASISQLYVWVSERPDKIEKHANVPDRVCKTCHVTQDTARWQRIAATAGHRVHLESDSSALKNIKCVTCHGRELHRFEPAKQTCGQAGCHNPEKSRIMLGKMAGQTVRHCTSCHQFTADVPALATRDSARGTLVPGASQCFGCHQMRKRLADFDPEKDPHGGKCGTCHNPHTQKTPMDAAKTCTTSGCHANWREEPFHSGENHKRIAEKCLTCHVPHSAKVDASDCAGCHQAVRARSKLQPPLPFDTGKALRRSDRAPIPDGIMVAAAFVDAPASASVRDAFRLLFDPPHVPVSLHFGPGPPRAPPAAPDSFPHSRHEKLACLVCHETAIGQGKLTFERPRGCQICHHQAPARSRCESCHRTQEYSSPQRVTATVTVAGHPPKPRPVDFLHASHKSRACLDCHTSPVTLSPGPGKAACRDCHEDHHAAGRNCSSCHSSVQPASAHKTLEASHQRCDACHTPATVARLTPTRSFCSTCHTDQTKDHFDNKECTSCHFLTDPSSYRSMLTTRARE